MSQGRDVRGKRFAGYGPLGFSWLLMTIDPQIVLAVVARRPAPITGQAALFLVFLLLQFVGAPMVDLITTATALGSSRAHFNVIKRFAFMTLGFVVGAHIVLAYSPLYGWVTGRILGSPPDAAVLGRSALMLVVPWTACIGWRRFCQGILIRMGSSAPVGWGTLVRLSSFAVSLGLLYRFTDLTGLGVGLGAMLTGVACEAAFATWKMVGAIKDGWPPEDAGDDLRITQVLRFHAPLTCATLIGLLVPFMIGSALMRLSDPELKLAAFQVGSSFLWLVSSFTFALPDYLISRHRAGESDRDLLSFTVLVSAGASVLVALLAALHLDTLYFTKVGGSLPVVANSAHVALIAGCFVPLLMGLQSYARAMVTVRNLTFSRFFALAVSAGAMVAVLALGVRLRVDGLVLAGLAVSVALFVELAILFGTLRFGSEGVNPTEQPAS